MAKRSCGHHEAHVCTAIACLLTTAFASGLCSAETHPLQTMAAASENGPQQTSVPKEGPQEEPAAEPSSISPPGSATNSAAQLNEVVVTATKRRENLQDVPASIEALSANALQTGHVFSVMDLSHEVPGFAVTSAQGTFNTFMVRGIGTLNNGYSVDPSVGLVFDDVVLGRPAAMSFFDYYDLERVEVLRGPQGTLFGMNTSAGAIHVVTNDPTEVSEAKVSVGYGSYNEVRTDGFLSGPLVDNKVLGRIAFFSDDRGGYIHDIYTGKDLNDNTSYGGRAKFMLTPAAGTRILISGDYQRQIGDCCATPVTNVTSPSANPLFYGGYPYLFAGFPSGFIHSTNHEVDAAGGGFLQNVSKGASIKWEQDIGDYTLTSITAYREWKAVWNHALLFNSTPVDVANPFDSFINQDQTSEELRIASPKGGRIDYVAGLFFLDDDIKDRENWLFDFATLLGTPVGVVTSTVDYTDRTRNVNGAAFGQANIHITHSLTLIAGARETIERATFNLNGHNLFDAPMQATASHTVHNISWQIGTRWQAARHGMVYATVSRGFKGPGYNGNSTIIGDAQYVKPEVSTNFETGWKSDLLNERLRVDLSAYYETLDDFQVNGYDLPPGQATAVQFLMNAPQIRSKGLEAELQALPVSHLRLNFDGALIDAFYESFPDSPCYSGQSAAAGCQSGRQNLSGQRTSGAPRFAFDGNGTYDIELPSLPFDGYVSVDYAWKSAVEWDTTNNPLALEKSYGLLGATLGVVGKGGHFSMTAYGRNLTNKYHTAGILIPFGPWAESVLPPDYKATYGITLTYRY